MNFYNLVVLPFLALILTSNFVYADKMKVSILEQIESTVPASVTSIANLKDFVSEALVVTGKVDVITRDRKQLEALFLEQKDSGERAGRVSSDGRKAEFGKIEGLDYVIMLKVNAFSQSVKQSALEQKELRSIEIGLNLQVVDASKGKIIVNRNLIEKKTFPVDKAYNSATNDVLKSLASSVSKEYIQSVLPIKVIDIIGNTAVLNYGESAGLKVGDNIEFFAIKEVKDIDTGELLATEYKVGNAKIVSVSNKTASAEIEEDLGIAVGAVAKVLKIKESSKKKDYSKSEDW